MNPRDKHSSEDKYGNKYGNAYGAGYGGKYDDAYEKKFNSFGKDDALSPRDLNNSEKSASVTADGSSDDIQSREKRGPWNTNVQPQEAATEKQSVGQRAKGIFKGAKKKGPLTALIVFFIGAIIGGGSFLSLAGAPLMFVSNVHFDLNDPSSALESRMEKKMANSIFHRNYPENDNLSFGCTGVGAKIGIKCKLKTLSPWMESKLKSQGIEVVGEKKLGGRIAPTEYKYKGKSYDAESLKGALSGETMNVELRQTLTKAVNMNWLGLKAKTFMGRVLSKFGLKSDQPIELTGTKEEKRDQLMNGKKAGTNGENLSFRKVTDEEGKESWVLDGEEPGADGKQRTYTDAEKAGMEKSIESLKGASKPLSVRSPSAVKAAGYLKTATSLTGVLEFGCQLRNMIGSAAIAAKVANAKQLAEYAMQILPLVGKMKAGDDITPEDAELVQSFFTDTDKREFITDYIASQNSDDPKDEKSASIDVGEVKNPNYGKNVMDSDLYKMSAGGTAVNPSDIDKTYSLGLGTKSTVQSIAKGVVGWDQKITNALKFDGCQYIQVIGIVGFIGGIALDAFGVGISATGIGALLGVPLTAANAARTAGLMYVMYKASSIVDRMLNASLTSSLIPDVMDKLSLDRAAATWTGMSALYSEASLARGMMPGDTQQILAYQQDQTAVKNEYIAFERQDSNPLDVKNPYSLTGSIAAAMGQHFPTSLTSSSLQSLPTSLSSFVFSGLTSLVQPYSAYAASQDPSRYEKCDDPLYTAMGINPDVQCNVRYVMPNASSTIDPLEAAQYMEDNGFVEPDTTTGYPVGYTPPDPGSAVETAKGALQKAGKDVKEFVKGTISSYYKIDNYGKYNVGSENGEGKSPKGEKYALFLDYCVNRALPFGMTYEDSDLQQINGVGRDWLSGKKCRDTEDKDINVFRTYVFDMSVNDDLDGPVIPDCPPGSANTTVASGSDNSTNAAAIDAIIAKYPTSPLNGKGNLIMEYANKYGVRADFFVTTFLAENQFATDGISTQLYKDSFNIGNNKASGSDTGDCGTTTYGGSTYKKYCSLESGIEGAFKSIAENSLYKDKLPTQNPLPDTKPNTVGAIRQIYCPEGDGGAEGCNLENFLNMAKSIGFTMGKDDPFYTGGATTTSTTSGNKATGTKMSKSELETLITSYGLPTPQASTTNGVKGYTELLSDLTSNPKAGWAAQQFLNGEKAYKSKGGDIKEYLTTAWVWIETGPWPDPYEMNCQSQTESTQATHYCDSGDFQVAGYQPHDAQSKFKEVYDKLYSESELTSVMENVVKNSTNASKDIWNYNDPSNDGAKSYFSDLSGVTLSNLWPSTSYNDEKAQIQSLILGKDPAMAAGLNSFAVSDGDVVAMLKDCHSLSWSNNDYYCDPKLRPLMANIMMALYMFDGSGPSSAVCGAGKSAAKSVSSAGISAIWGGVGERNTEYGFGYDAGIDLYDYGEAMGLGGTKHTGVDVVDDLEAPIYTPVDGTIMCSGTGKGTSVDGTGCGAFNDYMGHGNGRIEIKPDGTEDILILGHTSTSLVQVGQHVTAGTQVGTVGGMNGSHTHVEVRIKDASMPAGWKLVDPKIYLGGG